MLLLAPFVLALGCDEPLSAPTTAVSTVASAAKAPPPPAEAVPAPSTTAPGQDEPAAAAAKPEWITAQHVLVAFKGAKNAPATIKRTKDEAKKRAEEVATKAKAGDDFTALVKEYSDDAATLDRLGSVGYGLCRVVRRAAPPGIVGTP
jgi:hypothetical protein